MVLRGPHGERLVVNFAVRLEFQDGKRKEATQDYHGRGAVHRQVIRFLNDPGHRAGLRGVIGAGNRNFGATFALAARVISEKCQVPVLYRFELAGTETDLIRVRAGLDNIMGLECLTP